MNSRVNGKYIFKSGKELLLNISILPFVVLLLGAIAEVYIEVYTRYFKCVYVLLIITVLLVTYMITHPSYFKHLYYRWKVFRYNRTTTFEVDLERKSFTYKHGKEDVTFFSKDVEKWSTGEFRTWNTTFVGIVRIKLKDGRKIEISSGIGNVKEFLQENRVQLGLPKGTYRYGDDFKSLQSYIKRIEKSQ